MDIQETKKGNVTVVSLSGRLDSTNAGELEHFLSNILDTGEKNILLDCKNLKYISSSGLRVFLMGFKRTQSMQGILALCSLQEPIKEVFDISGFTGLFSIYNTQSDALASI